MTHPLTPREKVEQTPMHRDAAKAAAASPVPTALASGSGDHAELARLAEAATPGDLDTVPNPPSEYGGYSEGVYGCPACAGQGEVEGATYCNFDGVALGVQFFGIGNDHKNYEAFFRAANPATVLALLAENAALREDRDQWRIWYRKASAEINAQDDRATEAERKMAEAVGLLRDTIEEYSHIDDVRAFGEIGHAAATALIAARAFLSKEAERG